MFIRYASTIKEHSENICCLLHFDLFCALIRRCCFAIQSMHVWVLIVFFGISCRRFFFLCYGSFCLLALRYCVCFQQCIGMIWSLCRHAGYSDPQNLGVKHAFYRELAHCVEKSMCSYFNKPRCRPHCYSLTLLWTTLQLLSFIIYIEKYLNCIFRDYIYSLISNAVFGVRSS